MAWRALTGALIPGSIPVSSHPANLDSQRRGGKKGSETFPAGFSTLSLVAHPLPSYLPVMKCPACPRPGSRRRGSRWLGCLLAVLLLPAAAAPLLRAQPVFKEVSGAAGITYLQHAARRSPNCIFRRNACEPERMTGGAAVADVDADGLPDLLVTRLDAPDILFRNRGDGTFEDITAGSGLAAYDVHSNGAAFADIDNDGDPDLYLSVLGPDGDPINNRNYLFLNQGGGTFVEEAVIRGADVGNRFARDGFSVNAGDYDRDGWVDLHVTEWLPRVFSNSRLLHNLGPEKPGFFEDRTVAASVFIDFIRSFSSTFTDLDRDGWPDLAVAGDFGTSRLFWNNGDGTFTDGTKLAGLGTDENGMGSTFGDFDGDGLLDWFITSIDDPARICDSAACNWKFSGNRLYRNQGGRRFSDATDAAGVRHGFRGWGAAFLDYDNDGDLDLVMTNGVDFPDLSLEEAFNADPMRFWENDGTGSMTEKSAQVGLTDTGSGKGLLVFDYDTDGDMDIFLVNNAGTPRLYRNDGGNARDWLRVRTVGHASNREGLGAWVEIFPILGGPVQVREIGTSTHFLGQSERVAHFGLGLGRRPVDLVRITWPSGRVQSVLQVPRNSVFIAEEPDCADADGDGFCREIDCDDQHAEIQPLPEVCDLADNDCDGLIDEELPTCRDVRSIGFFRRLCAGDHPEETLLPADAQCVAASHTFSWVASVADLCAVLEARPRGDACARAETHLMALLLNRCQGRVHEALPVTSSCGAQATVGASLAQADARLAAADRSRGTCQAAQCAAEKINTGEALP